MCPNLWLSDLSHCTEETDKLRDSIRGKEQDLRFAEEAGQVANGEVARVSLPRELKVAELM